MFNVTDATCDFGLAQTEEGCVRTLASFNPDAYRQTQTIYCIMGAASLMASVLVYLRSVNRRGAKLQQVSYLLCCYASVTVVIRGADPRSYGHMIPRPIDSLIADSCTAALYTVYIMTLVYWAAIIQEGAGVIDPPAHLRMLEVGAITFVWLFYIVVDMVLFAFKGFNPSGMVYLQLTVSALMLAIISMVFLIYGLRVLARLQQHERCRKGQMMSVMSGCGPTQSYDMALSDDEDGVPVVSERVPTPTTPTNRGPHNGHAARIRNILVVAEAVSLVVIAGQMYMAVTRSNATSVELSCANGMHCETIKSKVQLLHVFQVVCVWALLWAFSILQKKTQTVAQPRAIV